MRKGPESCRSCERITNNFKLLRNKYPNYHNLPVKGRGDLNSKVCIVGLAPGLHGANKTGETFTGDYCSNILSQCLVNAGFYTYDSKPLFYLTNAMKCLPPNNKPKISELNQCRQYLKNELDSMINLKSIVALGVNAHNSILRCYHKKVSELKFTHATKHRVGDYVLFDSYHCSKINIQTGRLLKNSLTNILSNVKKETYD